MTTPRDVGLLAIAFRPADGRSSDFINSCFGTAPVGAATTSSPDVTGFDGQWRPSPERLEVIATTKSGRGVAFCTAYAIDLRHRHCYAGVLLPEAVRRSGLGAVVGYQFVQHVFRRLDLRKIYFSIPDDTARQYASAKVSGLEIEGRLRDHYFADGGYLDVTIASISRERFEIDDHR